jgi:hypothetical protein
VKPSRSIRDDPEHWRRRAKEARDIAEQMSDPVSREMMLQIAKEYDQIAKSVQQQRGRTDDADP